MVLLGDELPLVDPPRILEIERDAILGRQPNGERALRAVDARIHHPVELERHAELVGERLHVVELVHVHADGHRLERERQLSFEEQMDASQTLVIRAGNPRQPLVSLAGPSVQA